MNNRYSKILHHIGSKDESPKSSFVKKRTFEEYETEQKKTETDRLKEEIEELKGSIKFLENYIIKQHDSLFELKEHLQKQYVENQILQEGLLNEPPEVRNTDPLTPLDQKFVTFDQLNDHYQLFINRIQQQMATIGGGGETRLKYLDDIVGIATNPSAYDGKYLKYDDSTSQFVFDSVGGSNLWFQAPSEDVYRLSENVGIGTSAPVSKLEVVGDITSFGANFTGDVTVLDKPTVTIPSPVNSINKDYGILTLGERIGFIDRGILASFADTNDGYCQVLVQNKSNGESASSDIVLNNDQPDGINFYIDLGINSSNYIGPDDFSDPNGGYLYNTGGTLSIGTADPYDIKFNYSGFEVARISENGVGIGTTVPTAKLHVIGGDIKVGVNTSHGVVLTSENGNTYRLIVDNGGNLITTLVI